MLFKLCPHCDQKSFSASATGIWLCPYCQKDITHVQAMPGERSEEEEEDKNE